MTRHPGKQFMIFLSTKGLTRGPIISNFAHMRDSCEIKTFMLISCLCKGKLVWLAEYN